MKKQFLTILFLGWIAGCYAQVIKVSENPVRWTICTENTSYQVIKTKDNNLTIGYYGPMSGERTFEAESWITDSIFGTSMREIPYRGGHMYMEPVLEVIFSDGNRELELVYDGYETGEMEGYPYLRLDMKDIYYPFTVSQYIKVIPELDIIEKWLKIENHGKKDIKVEKAYSGSFRLPAFEYDLLQFSGTWGREFIPRQSLLTPGIKTIFNRDGKSIQHTPAYMIRPHGETDEFNGLVYFGGLHWTGTFKIDFAIENDERLQILGGITDWDTHWMLKKGEPFITPRMLSGVVANGGTNGASQLLHQYVRHHILPKPHNTTPKPVLYNSWYATHFDVNVEGQIALAKIAKEIGVELFVIDDGWFEGRTTSEGGLGDWYPDAKKFPDGLQPLISRVKELGMDFGVWVEPEMVNATTNLYKKHPDWVLKTPNRTAHEGRNQLVLNMAREDVKQFTIEWLDKLLSENDIKFIKWDMNRNWSELGWVGASPEKERELRIRYIRNIYEVLRVIRETHPDVQFEACSSGGGRVDLGILRYMDQTWPSDNTNPEDRLFIQYGYSHIYPINTMLNWVTDWGYGDHQKDIPLTFRFHSAMAATLGIGGNLTNWTQEQKDVAKEMIAQYKEVRNTIQHGKYYRLKNPFKETRSAVQFVSQDKSESVVFAFQVMETIAGVPYNSVNNRLVLHGLDADANYTVSDGKEEFTTTGNILMSSGIAAYLTGNYASKMYVITKQ
jgi:alpha-galactosidase